MGRIYLLLIALVAFSIGWTLASYLAIKDDSQLMEVVSSKYFRMASEAGVSGRVSYRDCRLEQPANNEGSNGVRRIGFCSAEEVGHRLYLRVAFGRFGEVLYFESEGL